MNFREINWSLGISEHSFGDAMCFGSVPITVKGVLKRFMANVTGGFLLRGVPQFKVTSGVGTISRAITTRQADVDIVYFGNTPMTSQMVSVASPASICKTGEHTHFRTEPGNYTKRYFSFMPITVEGILKCHWANVTFGKLFLI